MTREVKITTDYSQGQMLSIQRTNRYGYDRVEASIPVIVGAKGVISCTLEIPDNEDRYRIDIADRVYGSFVVWEGEGVQQIGLGSGSQRRSIPALHYTDTPTAAINLDATLGKSYHGCPVVSLEEQRSLCRYEEALLGESDPEICEIDAKMQERYKKE
ncbi:MAG: hypothetical protein HF962_00490 [Sulfurovum sp.]|nr:hypothetical protein [Sulfurovum sp.]